MRVALRRAITYKHAGDGGVLAAYLLDPMIEDAIREAIQKTATGSYLALEPQISRDILAAVGRALGPEGSNGAVLLTGVEIRRYVRRLVETRAPRPRRAVVPGAGARGADPPDRAHQRRAVTGIWIALTLSTIAVGAYVRLAKSRRRKAARRAVWGVREKAIAEVKDGQIVRITGRAVARAPLRTSPISRRACIGFSLVVDRHDTGNPAEQRVVDKEEFDSFVIADATGQAMLHGPFDVKLDPYDKRSEDLPPAFFEVLEREGVAGQELARDPARISLHRDHPVPG